MTEEETFNRPRKERSLPERKLLTIRPAELRDIPRLFQMIHHYAEENTMLPRPLGDLYENVREFSVAEQGGKVVACGALKIYSAELGEIRSLCVMPGVTGRGLGKALSEQILADAERYGLKTVFALTLAPGFFEKLGFREVPRERFPTKVWRDCLQCPRYFQCLEKAVVLDLPAHGRRVAASCDEPTAVFA